MVEGGNAVRLLAFRASVVVAAVYGFFLIFAQFAFVELLRAGGAGLNEEKLALGLMALAGITSGFLTAWRGVKPNGVRIAMAVAALAGAVAPFANKMPFAVAVAVTTGAALGVSTVGLSALIPAWCGVAWVGLGTGLGYACCNLPPVFQQSPAGQAWIGAGFAFIGMLAIPSRTEWLPKETRKVFPVWGAILIFTALVWMDSAAFFIIQHAEDLKSGTWGGGMLWRNAVIHLALAILAGAWLARNGARSLPGTAWVLLAIAALAVNADSTRGMAGWFYPAAVSLYSTALVAWPGWFSGVAGPRPAAWRAAWLFAIAGWFGSANGIGMAQTLNRVPAAFVITAGIAVLGVTLLSDRRHWRSVAAVGLVVMAGLAARGKESPIIGSAEERGHRVYISEGCIHCHSRYSRPGSPDEEIWGPSHGAEETLKGEPVLIGNRRQGPDLSNIGARRSETWLKLHFLNPQALAPDSSMPSYAHLFEDGRGDDLVRYLKLSGTSSITDLMAKSLRWKPVESAEKANGKALFTKHCAACHGATGGGNGPLAWHFLRKPANLKQGPFVWTAAGDDLDLRVSRAIKFGIPGSDMPGHETLPDRDVLALKDYVLGLRHP